MNKNVFCLVMAMFVLTFTACEKPKESITIDPQEEEAYVSPTADYFPEPCLEWWANSQTVKDNMLAKGYKLAGEEGEKSFIRFAYHGIEVLCHFNEFDEYILSYAGLREAAFRDILTNYSNSNDYSKDFEKSSGYGKYFLFTSKDKKTAVSVFSTIYDEVEVAWELEWFSTGSFIYDDTVSRFE